MSHFNVIQICQNKPSKYDWISGNDIYEDGLFMSETDWGGDTLNATKRANALKSIKEQLRPYATVSTKNKTIRFRKKEVVKRRWLADVRKAYKEFEKNVKEGAFSTSEYRLRQDIAELSSGDLFYDGYCKKFAAIVGDYLAGYLPQTLYIGAILDAHC